MNSAKSRKRAFKPAAVTVTLVMLAAMGRCDAQPNSHLNESKEQRDARMQWWREARFGMFIHWGLYAVPAGTYKGKQIQGIGEWIMENADIPVKEYEKFAGQFNPVKFDADEWVKIAKGAGMKYIVITSKHHDGFCLWDSKVTEYDIMDATPFKRDILKELSKACKKHDIRLCFYHSIMDWHHPDAQAPLYPHYNRENRSNPNFGRYAETYLKPQLKELVTNYGPLGVLWFDGEWIKDWTEPKGRALYDYVRTLQPEIIINNRVGKGRGKTRKERMQGITKGEQYAGDFGTPEQQIPPTGMPGVDWESCMTMNDTWGYKSYDHNWKSAEDLIRKLVDIASKGGNFLLNVGPTAEGLIPEASVQRLAAMGKWMAKNSESIYGTTASVFDTLPWGRCTAKPGILYLHVLDWPKNGQLEVPVAAHKVKRAYLLARDIDLLLGGEGTDSITITVPRKAPDPIDTVVALETVGGAKTQQAKDGSVMLRAANAVVCGTSARYESGGGKDNIGYWTNPRDYVVWDLKVGKPATFDVVIILACANGAGGSEYIVTVAGQELAGKVKDTGGWTNFVTEKLGTVNIDRAGSYTLSVRPQKMPRSAVMNLQSVKLVPVK